MRWARIVLLGSISSLGCRAAPRSTPDTPEAAAPRPDAQASVPAASAARVGQDAQAPSALSDLLHTTRASVAVSSNVDNPRDYPDHLVDGKSETAWNGRTGDLVGGFIKLQIPEEAQVDHLEMSAGFDKVGKDGDLFTMNHRIKRVRVSRDGVRIGEHTFDTDVRAPQSISIHAPGGTYEIKVLETVPGTKKEWRELCVSELSAMGTPGAAALANPETPVVTVGLLPHELENVTASSKIAAARLLGRTFPSAAEFCRAWDRAMGPGLDARRAAGELIVPRDHACRVKGSLSSSFAPSTEILGVTKVAVFAEDWIEERFAIETPSGVVVPDVKPLDTTPFNDPGCFGANVVTIDSLTASDRALEIVLTDAWRNDRTYTDEHGKVTSSSHQDDVAKLVIQCAPRSGTTTCTRKELSRTCHVDAALVDCKSF
jgi:hypothetical protein